MCKLITTYQADDGTTFDTQQECQDYVDEPAVYHLRFSYTLGSAFHVAYSKVFLSHSTALGFWESFPAYNKRNFELQRILVEIPLPTIQAKITNNRLKTWASTVLNWIDSKVERGIW